MKNYDSVHKLPIDNSVGPSNLSAILADPTYNASLSELHWFIVTQHKVHDAM